MIRKMMIGAALMMAAFVTVNAQSTYKSAIGARVSPGADYDAFAVSFKTFLAKQSAIELNAGVGSNRYHWGSSRYNATGVSVSGTYQHHFDIKPVAGLKWFIGGGVSVFHSAAKHFDDYDGAGVGIYPTGGADYKFKKIPLNVSVDIRPTFIAAGPDAYNDFYGGQVGLSARYTFR